MGLKEETIHIPLSRGVDSKPDPRALPVGRMSAVEQAIFEEIGGVQKRPGTATKGLIKLDGTSIAVSRSRALGTRGDELLLFAEGKCWSWNNKETQWSDRGRFESVLVDQKSILPDRNTQVMPDRAELGDVIVYTWNTTSGIKGYIVAVDKKTGSVYPTIKTLTADRIRVIAVGTRIHVYYHNAGTLSLIVVDPADYEGTIGSAAITVASDVLPSRFDVKPYIGQSEAIVAWPVTAGTSYKIRRLNAAGTVTTTRDVARVAKKHIAISQRGSMLVVVRVDNTTNDEIRHDRLNVADLTDTANVDVLVKTETLGTLHNITTCVFTSQASYVIWAVNGTVTPRDDLVKRGQVSGGSVTLKTLIRHSLVASHAVVYSDGPAERAMVMVHHDGAETDTKSPGQQPCLVLIDCDFVVGPEQGVSAAGEEVGILARLLPASGPGKGPAARDSHLGQIEVLGSDKYAVAGTRRKRLTRVVPAVDIIPEYVVPQYAEYTAMDFVFTFFDPRAFLGVEVGRSLYLPGGYLAMFDGKRVSESGVLIYPEAMTFTTATTGGVLEKEKYSYIFIWEWFNAQGEVIRSSYAGAILVDLTASATNTNKVTWTVPTCPYTNKENLVLAGYRTKKNPGPGAPYYRWTSLDPAITSYVRNDVNADTVSVVDNSTNDIDLALNELFYLNDAGSLDDIPPPPTQAVAAGQSRLFTFDPDDPHLIRHSKLRLSGDAVACNDALTIRLPEAGGKATAMSITEEAIVGLKEEAVYIITGAGPDNRLQGSYGTAQPLPIGVGALDQRSIVRTPAGLIFKGKKGIYLLKPDYSLDFIGAPVEERDSLVLASAVSIPGKHQIRFLHTTGGTLVYDYLIGEWAYWPTIAGANAGKNEVLWQGTPVHLTSANIFEETTGFQDATTGYSLNVETPWIKLAELQGYAKLWAYEILGEFRSTCDLEVGVAFDYDPSFVDVNTWTPTPATAGKPMRVRLRVSRMSVEAVKFYIKDKANGLNPLNEGIKLTGLSLIYGVQEGLADLPPAQTV